MEGSALRCETTMRLAPAMMMMVVAALPAGHFLSLRDSEAGLFARASLVWSLLFETAVYRLTSPALTFWDS